MPSRAFTPSCAHCPRIYAKTEAAAPAFHRFQDLPGELFSTATFYFEFLSERIKAVQRRIARHDQRCRAEVLREVKHSAACRGVGRQALNAIRAHADARAHAGLDGGNFCGRQIVIEVLLHLRAHALHARRFDEWHQRGVRSRHRFKKRETHAGNGEVPICEPVVRDQRARAPCDALQRIRRARDVSS